MVKHEHNSGSTNSPVTFTNAYTNAGDYAFHFLFGATTTVANNWRNNQYPDLVELGSNYTFQNKRDAQPTTLLITRKDSNAFTFDSNRAQDADFGESPITDTRIHLLILDGVLLILKWLQNVQRTYL